MLTLDHTIQESLMMKIRSAFNKGWDFIATTCPRAQTASPCPPFSPRPSPHSYLHDDHNLPPSYLVSFPLRCRRCTHNTHLRAYAAAVSYTTNGSFSANEARLARPMEEEEKRS